MINSHYIPQFILRNFSKDYKIQYCDIEKRIIEERNIKSSFASKGYYPKNIESDLCTKIESQFARLLKEKITNQKNNIELTKDEMFILKKFLVVTVMRYNLSGLWKKDATTPDEVIQSYSEKFYENINKILECNSLENMMEYLQIDNLKNLSNINSEIGDIKFYSDIKNILHSYLVFVKTNRCNENFIIPDLGFASEATHLSMFSGKEFDKCTYTLNYAIQTHNPQLLYMSELMSPYDYFIFPISKDMAIMSFSVFFKFFNKNSDVHGLLPVNGLTVSKILGFGDSNLIEPPKVKRQHDNSVLYKYVIKQLSSSDTYYLNSVMLNQIDIHFGYHDFSGISSSIDYYINLSECYQNHNLKFVLGEKTKSLHKEKHRLIVKKSEKIIQRMIELSESHDINRIINSDILCSIKKEMINVERAGIKEVAQEYLIHSGDKTMNLDQTTMMLIISSIIELKSKNKSIDFNYVLQLILKESKIFKPTDFSNNLYLKNIKIDNMKHDSNALKLGYAKYEPYEIFEYNTPAWYDETGFEIPKLGCFNIGYEYPAIINTSTKHVLYSVSPTETITVEKAINNSVGNVLVLGCGMGYYSYMISLKDKVQSITIVESNETIINIFKEHILPQFENKEKIKILKTGKLEYLKTIKDGKFDYCYIDTCYIDNLDSYFKAKEIGRNFIKTKFDYRIEYSFAVHICRFIYAEILNAFTDYDENFYSINMSENNMRTVKYVKNLLANTVISNSDEIDYYMNPKNIIKLIEKTDIIY